MSFPAWPTETLNLGQMSRKYSIFVSLGGVRSAGPFHVTARLSWESEGGERRVASGEWRGEPEARLQCGPGGQLFLTRVQLSAWQGIDLPRQWDNPDREWDEEPGAQLEDFAARLHRALGAWESALQHLLDDCPRTV